MTDRDNRLDEIEQMASKSKKKFGWYIRILIQDLAEYKPRKYNHSNPKINILLEAMSTPFQTEWESIGKFMVAGRKKRYGIR